MELLGLSELDSLHSIESFLDQSIRPRFWDRVTVYLRVAISAPVEELDSAASSGGSAQVCPPPDSCQARVLLFEGSFF